MSALLLLCIGSSAAWLAPSVRAENATSKTPAELVQERILQLPEIRIWMGMAPNFGHQAHGAYLIRRLLALGYTGTIHVVVEFEERDSRVKYMSDKPIPTNQEKVAFLLQDLKDEKNLYPENLKIEILTQDEIRDNRFSRTALAISAAYDRQFHFQLFDFLNSDLYLQLSPKNWSGDLWTTLDKFGKKEDYWLNDDESQRLSPYVADLIQADLRNTRPVRTEELLFEKTDPASKNLDVLLSGLDQFNVLPMYGNLNGGLSTVNLVIKALHQVISKQDNKKRLHPKGTVIACFNPSISSWMLNGADNFKYLKIDDPTLAQQLENSHPEDLFLIEIGPVSSRIYHQFLSKSLFPPWIEGKGSALVMRSLARPFFLSGDREILDMELNLRKMKGFELWSEASKSTINENSVKEQHFNALAQFFQATLEQDKDTLDFFQAFAAQTPGLNDDKFIHVFNQAWPTLHKSICRNLLTSGEKKPNQARDYQRK